MGRPVDGAGNEIFVEYPKMLADGYIAQSSEDERQHLAPPPPPEPEPALVIPDVLDDPDGVPPSDNPLDDVVLEGAALNNGHVPEPEPDDEPVAGKSRKKK